MHQEIYYRKFGDIGPNLIIIHGLFGSSDSWQSLAKSFADTFQVYTVDLRNHGKSFHSEAFSYSLMAEDLFGFWADEILEPCFWLGHSLGGKTVIQLAHLYPEVVAKMVVIDIANKKYARRHEDYFNAMLSLDLTQIENRNQAEQKLLDLIPDWKIRQFLLKNLRRDRGEGYHWKFNLRVLNKHYDEILDKIEFEKIYTDTLFIRGGLSDYVTDDDFESIQASFDNPKIVTIAEASHWVHVDQSTQLIKEVKNFLL
jgi:pimeloyl-ACP methyl ester carboxylesterase